jgi:nickel transport protein
MKRTTILATLAAIAFSSSALAHGVWLAERHGEMTLVYGHGADDDPYDPSKVTQVQAFDAAGKEIPADLKLHENHATLGLPDEAAIVAVEFDNGFWTEREDGNWVNEPKSAVADAKSAGHYLKHNISLLTHGDLTALPDSPLQIVPLVDPLDLEPGDALQIKVLLDGAPLAGAEIINDYVNLGDVSATTDTSGLATVPVRNRGLNVLAVSHEVSLEGDPNADKRQHFATFSFTLAHHGD